MKRIAVFRDGNMMGAMIGPDLVIGLGGFGDTVSDALRDMADYFDKHSYSISDNRVELSVHGKLVSASGKSPSDAIRNLAWIVVERKYREEDFAEPDWNRVETKQPLVTGKERTF